MHQNNVHPTTKLALRATLTCVLVFLNLLGLSSVVGPLDVAFAVPMLKDLNLQVQTVASGLSSPTSMAFIGPNDILVLEKNTGMVKRVKDGVVLFPPLLDFNNVATDSERGLLGIAVLKTSSIHHYVFLYVTKKSSSTGIAYTNQLIRYIFTNNPDLGSAQGRMSSPQVLLNLPVSPGPNHNGGKVVIGPGANVYTVIGDINRRGMVQNVENGRNADGTGGILRVMRDGNTVGSGILGGTHPLDKYFAYGIRNSFGIDFDPVTGALWDTENGPASNDEINLVFPGFNSGWIDIMGMAPAGFDFNNLEDFDGRGTYSNPEFVWSQVVAPTAIEFLNSASLGSQYQNDMFVADFNNGRIYNFNLNSQRNTLLLGGVLSDRIANTDSETQSVIFGEGFGRLTDLKVGSGDGYLYALSISDGAIYRILPRADSSLSDNPAAQELRKSNEILTESPNEKPRVPYAIGNEDDKSNEERTERTCQKLADRMDQIDEQKTRGTLSEEQVSEIKERIQSIGNNLGCR